MNRRLVVALTFVAVSMPSVTLAQVGPPQFPAKHRTTDVDTLIVAANNGDSEAMLWLGVRHANGKDVTRDHEVAAAWYRRAADLGQASAMFSMGVSYWSGRGVTQDFIEAYKWLDLSAKYGNPTERDRAVGARSSLARVLTQQKIREARARVVEWERDFAKRQKS